VSAWDRNAGLRFATLAVVAIEECRGVACRTTLDCEAVGYNDDNGPVLIGTTDGGPSWQSESIG
jgi:hypothetical protein